MTCAYSYIDTFTDNTNMLRKPLATLALFLAMPVMATPLIVDGNLKDWNVIVADSKNAQPASIFTSVKVDQGRLYDHAIEDSNDKAGHGVFLGPHYGGQDYDVEFMAVAIYGSRIHLAIVSGQRPDNGFAYYSPGDLRIIDNNGRSYGMEIGGGAGRAQNDNKSRLDAITAGAAGSTYQLDKNGNTIKHTTSTAAQVAGSVWSNVSWINSPIDGQPVQFAINRSSRQLGLAEYYFSRDAYGSQHSIIELSLDASWFSDASNLDFYWAPSCNNDLLSVKDDLTYNNRVPLPGTLALVGLGIAGLSFMQRRRGG